LFGLTILGNNSAIPAFDRHPTAQALAHEDQVYLIDCGEGTQMQLSRYKIKRSKINHIFISHLHGDHYFGLIGLLTSMGLMGREHLLHIYAPPLLQSIIQLQLDSADTQLKFPIAFIPLTGNGMIMTSNKMEVSCFSVKHRIPCYGFLFREKKQPRKLILEKALEHGIPPSFFHFLQLGYNYEGENGKVVINELVTVPNRPGRTYAYSADTIFDEGICDVVRNVDVLYHEATYLHEMHERAAERFHSTARQAARIAQMAGVKKLLIGHFSSKYEDLSPFYREAAEIFEPVEIAREGVTFRIIQATH
jgi:ribonuclease Z